MLLISRNVGAVESYQQSSGSGYGGSGGNENTWDSGSGGLASGKICLIIFLYVTF